MLDLRRWLAAPLAVCLLGGMAGLVEAADPLPLGCGIPGHTEGTAPHLQDGDGDGQNSECHGNSDNSGTCSSLNGSVKCTDMNPRSSEVDSWCSATAYCSGGGKISCGNNRTTQAWAGRREVNGQTQWFVQCEEDNNPANQTLTACP